MILSGCSEACERRSERMSLSLEIGAIDALFEQLLELPSGQREPHLDMLEHTQPQQARMLRRLLQLFDAADTGALRALGNAAIGSGDADAPSVPGYVIQREIGRGGMGAVYEAVRTIHGTEQSVAIKVLRAAILDPVEHQRFINEQRILARLRHPNIAVMLEAGSVEARPYMVLEHIDGLPIDQRLMPPAPPAAVLDAIGQVLDALQLAHEHFIVHRDIKPDNVLVDAEGRIKLIDFGIAKMLVDAQPAGMAATRTGMTPLTLRYASPEQLLGQPVGVASDIYQVGLLMYRLLTNAWPFDEDERQLPTLRTQRDARALAPSRRVADARARRRLSGDIDSIVLRCLRFEPTRRYRSAADLKHDIQCHLRHRPVSARSRSRGYLVRSFVMRHRVGVTLAASAMLLVVLALGFALLSAQRSQEHAARLAQERNAAEHARHRAESIYDFMLDIIGSGDPEDGANRGRGIDELLADGAARAKVELAEQPLIAAQLLLDIGSVLWRRSQLPEAERALRGAIELWSTELGANAAELIQPRQNLALVLQQQQRLPEAHQLALTALADAGRLHGPRSVTVTHLLKTVAVIESAMGDQASAEARLREALRIDAELSARPGITMREGSPAYDNRIDIRKQLAVILLRTDRHAEAEPMLAEAVAQLRVSAGALDPRTLEAQTNHAYALRQLGHLDQAHAILVEVLAGQRQIYSGPHRQAAYTLGHLAAVETDRQRFHAAEQYWQQAETEAVAALGEDHPWIGSARFARARALRDDDRIAEAIPLLRSLSGMPERADGLVARASSLLAELDR